MSTKHLRTFAIVSVGAVVIPLSLYPARLSTQERTVAGGTITTVAPGDDNCRTDETIRTDVTDGGINDHGCMDTRLFTNLITGEGLNPFTIDRVDLTATARFVKQFHVQAVQGAPTTSFVPILIAVPVMWRGLLSNDSVVPALGPLDSVGAHIDVNMFLRITQGTPADPARTTVTENRFNTASHAGIAGCLAIPEDSVASAATIAGTCALAVLQINAGSGTVYLSGIVETGKTYNIELELRSDLFSLNAGILRVGALGGHAIGDFAVNVINNNPFGLIWMSP